MGFNKFNKNDGIRIIVVLFIMALVYLGSGSKIWLAIKKMSFQLPFSPATLTPTPTPTNTSTPSPTFTPAPTSTPMPTPIPTSEFISGELISFWNEFDNTDPLRGDWAFFPNVIVENGTLLIEQSEDWSGVYGNPHLRDGQTILLQFRFENWSDLHIAIETGEFETESYRSWGVGSENNIFSPVFSEGTIEFENSFAPEDVELVPGKWYILMLHIGGNRPFITRLWEFGNPDKSYNLEVQMNESWIGQDWSPLFLVGPSGKLEIDRYEELKNYTP